MFSMFKMEDDYEKRVIGRDDFDWGFVSTAMVSDGAQPYETAVLHSNYAEADDLSVTRKMVIVEGYESAAEAKVGHAKWLDTMVNTEPDKLIECGNAKIASLAKAMGISFDQVLISSQDKRTH